MDLDKLEPGKLYKLGFDSKEFGNLDYVHISSMEADPKFVGYLKCGEPFMILRVRDIYIPNKYEFTKATVFEILAPAGLGTIQIAKQWLNSDKIKLERYHGD